MRQGFMGTPEYRDQLRTLRAEEVSFKDELENGAYDRFLYHTGQSNRIAVESVMLGSTAEQSGIKSGDMIVRYEDQPLYNYRDLRGATISGERDEIVAVTVLRNGNELTMSIPRGPLGIQLNAVRLDPNG